MRLGVAKPDALFQGLRRGQADPWILGVIGMPDPVADVLEHRPRKPQIVGVRHALLGRERADRRMVDVDHLATGQVRRRVEGHQSLATGA